MKRKEEKTMKKTLIISGRNFYLNDEEKGIRKEISEFELNRIFIEWKKAGKRIYEKYGMNGKMHWLWVYE